MTTAPDDERINAVARQVIVVAEELRRLSTAIATYAVDRSVDNLQAVHTGRLRRSVDQLRTGIEALWGDR